MPKIYGERSSSPTEFSPGGLITTKRFAKQYRAARSRHSERASKAMVPYEYETTALFEDLYNHRLFPGEDFSNNSQQPPHNTSKKACDIVTRYWSPDGKSRTFLFTEAKRENRNDIGVAETQLQGYCQTWLKTQESRDAVFGATVHGTTICFFLVAKSNKAKLERLCSYIDVKDNNGCDTIRRLVRVMTTWAKLGDGHRNEVAARSLLEDQPATSPPQGTSGGPSPQSSLRSSPPHGQNMDPRDARTRSREPSPGYDSRRRSPSAAPGTRTPGRDSSPGYDSRRRSPSASPAAHTLAMHGSSPAARRPPGYDAHGYSPAGRYQQGQSSLAPPNAMAGSSRQPSPALSRRPSSRSPPDRSTSPMPARQRDPAPVRVDKDTAYEAAVAVRRWGSAFEDTQFLVWSLDGTFREFTVLGSKWRTAEVGQSSRRCFVIDDPELGYIYTRYIDPVAIRPVPNTNANEPSWVARGGWWQER